MPDMLVRLYDLPDPASYYRRAGEAGVTVRRAQPWERSALRAFIEGRFSPNWADETEAAFSRQPVSAFVALAEREIAGFAAYECTRRGYFGPTGVREELRGKGIGAALLFRCLEGFGSWATLTASSAASARRSSTRMSAGRSSSPAANAACTAADQDVS